MTEHQPFVPETADAAPGYQVYREARSDAALIAASRARLAENAPEDGPGAPESAAGVGSKAPDSEPPPQAVATGEDGAVPPRAFNPESPDSDAMAAAGAPAFSPVTRDIAGGLVEAPRQVMGGVRDAIAETMQAIDGMARWLDTHVVDLESGARVDLPEVAAARTVTGGVVRSAAQFLTGFLPALKVAKAAGLGSVAAPFAAGGAADATVFDPHQERLANLWRDAGLPENVLTDWLAAKEGDSELEGRFKNAVEGAVLGVLTEGVFKAARVLRAARRARRAGDAEAADPLAAARAEYGELKPGELTAGLGDPEGPLVAVKAQSSSGGTPNSARRAADAGGAAMTPATSLPPGTQRPPRQLSTRPEPSGSSTRREIPPSKTGPSTTFTLGDMDRTSNRKIVQPSGDVNVLLHLAGAAEAPFRTRLDRAVAELPGVAVLRTRVKAALRLGQKSKAGQPPQTVGDYLGGRIVVDTPQQFDAAIARLSKEFKNVDYDDFLEAPRPGGYRGVHMQVVLDNGITAEVQVLPREIAEVQAEAHRIYAKWRANEAPTPEQMRQRKTDRARSEALFSAAYERWTAKTPGGGKLASAEAATARAAPDGGPRIVINFARIEGPDDVKRAMADMADAFAGGIDRARRGVRSHAATREAADALGMDVETLLARRGGQPLSAEESLAARRLWVASTEKLLEMARAAAAPNAGPIDQFRYRRMTAIHYAVQAEVLAARAETARALNAWAIPAGGGVEQARAVQQLLAASGGADVSAAMARRLAILGEADLDPAAIAVAVRRGWAATTMDAVRESFVLGLLWSPKTHLVNVVSNSGFAALQIGERAVAARLSRLAGREAGEGVEVGEALAMTHGLVMSLRDAFTLAGRALRTGKTGQSLGKIDLPRERAISAKAFNLDEAGPLGRVVDFAGFVTGGSGRMLGAEDEFFKTIGYRMELHAQAFRTAAGDAAAGRIPDTAAARKARVADIVADPPENIRITAADAALYNTFTNQPGKFGQAMMGMRDAGRLNPLFMVLPFVRTPTNILARSFERTPLAPLVGQWRAEIAAGGARRDVALARLATGSAFMALAADYAYSGFVSGPGPDDRAQREALLRQGWQPWSVYVGGRWYEYKRTDPFGMLMGFSASMAEMLKQGEVEPEDLDEWQEVVSAAIAATSLSVVDKTYFTGMSQVIEALNDPDRYAPTEINRLIGSFVPLTTAVGTAAQAVDPTFHEVNDPWQAVMARLPGLAARLTPRRDLWGRRRAPDAVYGKAYDLVSPVRVSQTQDSPIDAEMTALRFGVARIRKRTSMLGVAVNLRGHAAAYDEYVRLAGHVLEHPVWGKGAKDFLDEMVQGGGPLGPLYQTLPKAGKIDEIKKHVFDYRRLAAARVLADPRFADLRAEWERGAAKKQAERAPPGMPDLPAGLGLGIDQGAAR